MDNFKSLKNYRFYKTVPLLRLQCIVCPCKLTQLARYVGVPVGLAFKRVQSFDPLNFGRVAKALSSRVCFNVGHGTAWIKEQTALVYHCDSLLPPCQPFAALFVLPNYCDSCVALLLLSGRPLRPRSQCFLLITPLPPPNRAVDTVGFPLWIRRSSNIIDFRFSCPHKPPSAPPIPVYARASTYLKRRMQILLWGPRQYL